MKQKITSLFLLFSVIFVLNSCAKADAEQQFSQLDLDAISTKEDIDIPAETEINTYSETTVDKSADTDVHTSMELTVDHSPWYGQWKVAGFIQLQFAELFDAESVEGYLDARCWYSYDQFTSENVMYVAPSYSASIVDRSILDNDMIYQCFEQDIDDRHMVYEDYEPIFQDISVIMVTIYNTNAFGSTFYYIEGNEQKEPMLIIPYKGVLYKAVRDDKDLYFSLSERGKRFLQEMCYCIPTFSSDDDMDYSFWEEFLIGYYTNSFQGHENVEIYRADLGYEVTYSKVSRRDAEDLAILTFDRELPQPDLSLSNGHSDEANLLYDLDERCYFIEYPENDECMFNFVDCELFEEGSFVSAKVIFNEYLEGDDMVAIITFYLKPMNNENGFVIYRKQAEFL